ncbi:MAG: hypothetical protein OSB36_03680, partial [Longimicrobiales bacterium]|nr:hypothetical protein [Longimicrobiales bacterium]
MPSRWNSPSQLVMQAVPVEKRHVGVALPCHDPVADLEVEPVVRQVVAERETRSSTQRWLFLGSSSESIEVTGLG